MRPGRAWAFLALGLAASALHLLVPGSFGRALTWDTIGVTASAAAWWGIRRNRPDHPVPWRFLAAGLTLFAAGDLTWDVSVHGFGHSARFVLLANVVYLSAYPFLAFGLIRLGLAAARRRGTFLDAGVATLAISAPLLQFVIAPTISEAKGFPTLASLVNAAYPILDCILLIAVANIVFALPRRNASGSLLVLGLLVNIVADILYARGILADGTWLDAMWPASYVLLAAATLHPSMNDLAQTHAERRRLPDRARGTTLTIALLALPGMLVVDLVGEAGALERALQVVVGVAIALVVGWRITNLLRESGAAHDVALAREARFAALVGQANDAIAVNDADGKFVYMSPPVTQILGRDPEAFLGSTIFDFLHPDDHDAVGAFHTALARASGSTHSVAVRIEHADGSYRWIETITANRVHEPAVGGYVSNFRDVTERMRTERFGSGATGALELIAAGAPVSATLEHLLGVADAALDGFTCIYEPASEPGRGNAGNIVVCGRLAPDDLAPRWSVPVMTADGHRVGSLTTLGPGDRSPDEYSVTRIERIARILSIAIDGSISASRLEHQAFHDPLTGLPNRALLLDRLAQTLLRVERSGGRVALFFLDLDRFKIINDGLGHESGDELLVEVATRLQHAVQSSDTVARFGGDEFVVVCERLRDPDDARTVAERLARVVAEPFVLRRGSVVVPSVSIGIALADGAHHPPETLLRDADAAMYRAKAQGPANIEVFDSVLRSRVVVRLETEIALRRALERGELRVFYQPIVELSAASATVVGEEALLRWKDPERGLIAPGEFIPIAEETGLIVPIGSWVLGEACRDIARVAAPGDVVVPIAVNLSGRQLASPDLARIVEEHLDASGASPDQICLEITESVLLDDVNRSMAGLRSLKNLGVQLAVDDFGTGYSSLDYLRRFPFDILKIDRAFIADLGTGDAGDAIVRAMVQMAHAMGMRVVAEGIETKTQRDRAIELGCDLAQGFLWAPARPRERHADRLLRVVS